ncbi:hypothetical protein CVIRNUC_006959 [Coccomyxa viridis]|uniref:Uncharacterized protein n=1 Tax=Coccomyxa viridis TaxID=1274662 RepID=A0AAV1I9L5_9CHLO|nr:hypothetical protein CVIRNUC_006959 [Coccomyxa viridis]
MLITTEATCHQCCWDQAPASIETKGSPCCRARCDRCPAVQVPEDLSEIQKCLMQLTGGHAIQQMHAIGRQSLAVVLSPTLHVYVHLSVIAPWVCMRNIP